MFDEPLGLDQGITQETLVTNADAMVSATPSAIATP